MRTIKFIGKVLMCTDVLVGLVWFDIITLAFGFAGWHPIPHGYLLMVSPILAAGFAISPDLDMIPYILIRKRKEKYMLIIACVCVVAALATLLIQSPVALFYRGVLLLGFAFLAIGASRADLVRTRASHWPIWHHPIPFLISMVAVVLPAAFWFDRADMLYWIVLAIPLVVWHFGHDATDAQGFPIFSPFSEAHFHLSWAGLKHVPQQEVEAHYNLQYMQARHHSTLADMESRTEPFSYVQVTSEVLVLILAVVLCWQLQ